LDAESGKGGGEGEDSRPNPLQRALDLFVFAPVGAALTVAEDLPGVITKGRERIEGQIRNAKVIGQFVVTQGQQDLTQRIGKLLHGSGDSSGAAAPGDVAGDSEDVADSAEVEETAPMPKPPADPADAALVEGALAGYDTLSASQVVRRLESLSPDELRAVHRHEASHRNRRTILHRTNQLLGGAAQSEAT
jgi:hypothetical protein